MTPEPPSHAAPDPASVPSARRRLADTTTLGLGGFARAWSRVQTVAQLRAQTERAHKTGEALLLLGGGSNLVCADEGFEGRVVEVALRGAYISGSPPDQQRAHTSALPALSAANTSLDSAQPALQFESTDVWLHLAAGEPWDRVVAATCRWGWAGVECLSGIPGNVGATPIQNVGAYGQELADCLTGVTCLDRKTGKLVWLSRDQCGFGYRHSRFKDQDVDTFVVVEIVLRLTRDGTPTVRYPELARQLTTATPSLSDVRSLVLSTRASKSMLLDPSDANGRNCGSFFVNPVINREQWHKLQHVCTTDVPHFAVDHSCVKVPAAWLIEQAGFARGHRVGNVGLSSKHTLCLVAHDGATAFEFIAFARHVRDTVLGRFGIELRPEPVLVGIAW